MKTTEAGTGEDQPRLKRDARRCVFAYYGRGCRPSINILVERTNLLVFNKGVKDFVEHLYHRGAVMLVGLLGVDESLRTGSPSCRLCPWVRVTLKVVIDGLGVGIDIPHGKANHALRIIKGKRSAPKDAECGNSRADLQTTRSADTRILGPCHLKAKG